jgi:hypothetical protein
MPCADGPRAGDEPGETGEDRQPSPAALEGPPAHLHRGLYFKRFGKERPDVVLSIEGIARKQEEKKAAKREAKRLRGGSEP